MSSREKKSSDFLVQGSILAIASIVSRIIGLVYRMPMTAIIGDLGNSYYGAAYEVYNIMLLFSSYSIPLAVSKVVSRYGARKELKTVNRVFKAALALAVISGLAACLLVWYGAGFITTTLLKTPLSIYALRVLAPTLVIFAILGVFRGFFQGLGTMMPTAVSQIIEQLINAFVSVAAAYFLFRYGAKIGGVLGNTEEYSAAYGAAGGTLGTTMGVIGGLLFILFIYAIFKPGFSRKLANDKGRTESYGRIFGWLIWTIFPVLLSTTIYNISGIIDQGLFKNIAVYQNYSSHDIDVWWGIFSGKYKVLINVPISIASAMVASTVPAMVAAYAKKDMRTVRKNTNRAIRFVMIIAIPCAVGMGVLASPIMQLLFNDSSEMAAGFLRLGVISIVFYSLSTLTNGILQGIDRMGEPIKNALIALVVHLVLLAAMMLLWNWNIYAVIIATAVYSLIMCVLNGRSIRKYMRYRQEVTKTFLIPTLASAAMGIAVYYTYDGLMKLVSNNAAATILSIVEGVIIYALLLLLLRGISAEELATFPKGTLLVKICRKLHLLK